MPYGASATASSSTVTDMTHAVDHVNHREIVDVVTKRDATKFAPWFRDAARPRNGGCSALI
jgi:hypothetical protein